MVRPAQSRSLRIVIAVQQLEYTHGGRRIQFCRGGLELAEAHRSLRLGWGEKKGRFVEPSWTGYVKKGMSALSCGRLGESPGSRDLGYSLGAYWILITKD
jgi:hypothetical protein